MINSQINILAQAKTYLHSVTVSQYQQIINPLFISSAGAHMRHILDHYTAILMGFSAGFVDYDLRSRGGEIETDIDKALVLIGEVENFLLSLSKEQLQQKIQLSTEVSIDKKQVEVVMSTLARELVFVGSHAIHHFAMIEQISKTQLLATPEQFGIAPATATFLRGDTSEKIGGNKCAH